jgi:GDP-L-fucose synthase
LKVNKLKITKVNNNELPIFNIGSGESISIENLALLIKKITYFKGRIIFDKKYPDGTINKNLDSRKIKKFHWKAKITLEKGLKKIINLRN